MDDPTTSGATEGFGLMFYNARWYDPALGRFAQADTVIPEQSQGTQAWDRYAYTNNDPVKNVDPTGHMMTRDTGIGGGLSSGGSNTPNPTGPDEGIQFGITSRSYIRSLTFQQFTNYSLSFMRTVSVSCSYGNCTIGVAEPLTNIASPVAMLNPSDEMSQTGAAILRDSPLQEGAYHLIGHGYEYMPAVQGENGKLFAPEVADIIESDPRYNPGTPVCLVSCYGASSGIGQELANILDVPVFANTEAFGNSWGGFWTWLMPQSQ